MKTPRDVEGDLATEELVDPAEATASADAIIAPKDVVGRSPWEIFWRQFRKDRWALAGIVIVVIMILLAILAPLFARIVHHGPNDVNLRALDDFGLPSGPSNALIRDISVAIVIRPFAITVAKRCGDPTTTPPCGDTSSVHLRTLPSASRDLFRVGRLTVNFSFRLVVLATTRLSGSISRIVPSHGAPSWACKISATNSPTLNRSKWKDCSIGLIATLLTRGGALSDATRADVGGRLERTLAPRRSRPNTPRYGSR